MLGGAVAGDSIMIRLLRIDATLHLLSHHPCKSLEYFLAGLNWHNGPKFLERHRDDLGLLVLYGGRGGAGLPFLSVHMDLFLPIVQHVFRTSELTEETLIMILSALHEIGH